MNSDSVTVKFLFFILFIAVLLWGTALRINDQWTKDLWVDEVWRAQQILHAESYSELKAGKYFGMEPAVHLSEYVLGKIGLYIFGKSEIAFRFWPLLFSICSLVVFAVLSIFLLSNNWALFATFLYAGSAGLIEHSHEFKPYSYESLIINLFLLAIILRAKYKSIRWPTILLLIFTFLSVIYTAIWPFIWTIVLAQICYEFWPRRHELKNYFYACSRHYRTISIIFILVAIASGGIFATEYLYNLKARKIFNFWQPYTLTSSEQIKAAFVDRLGEFNSWYVTSVFTNNEVLYSGIVLTLIYYLIVPLQLYSKKSLLFVPLIAVLLSQIILSLLGLFPVFTRVGSFQVGFYVLAISALGEYFSSSIGRNWRRVEFAVLLIFIPIIIFFHGIDDYAGRHSHIQQIKPLLTKIERFKDKNTSKKVFLITNYSAQLGLSFYGIDSKINSQPEIIFKDKKVTSSDVKKLAESFSKFLDNDSAIFILVTHRTESANIYKDELRKLGYQAKLHLRGGAYLIKVTQQHRNHTEKGSA